MIDVESEITEVIKSIGSERVDKEKYERVYFCSFDKLYN